MKIARVLVMLATLLLAGSAHAQIAVQTELMLLCDVSGSIDTNEFNLQRQGYANAFNSVAVQNLVAQATGGIAVSLVYWSGATQHQFSVGWTHLYDNASCSAFASAVAAGARPFAGSTAPGSAINFGDPTFWNNNFTSLYQIMDVSGDGIQNDGLPTAAQRNLALSHGIDRINGLAIQDPAVFTWYQNNVQGGADSFTYFVNDFADFEGAIENKILHEVSPVPEPTTLVAMLAAGLFGLIGVGVRRLKESSAG